MNNYSNLRTVSCSVSLSSCRLKAEAIARALNNRIWPNSLLHDCDSLSDEETLQVTPALKIARNSNSENAIDRAPQAHDIYDGQQKVIGHCYVNGLDEEEEYFDTPNDSSVPSPVEEEIIVNPPVHIGVPPFYTGPCYQLHGPVEGASSQIPNPSEEKIVDSAILRERLLQYTDSLPLAEDMADTFYDISDDEDSPHKIPDLLDEAGVTVDPQTIETTWTETSESTFENIGIGSIHENSPEAVPAADDIEVVAANDALVEIDSDSSQSCPSEESIQSNPTIAIESVSPTLDPIGSLNDTPVEDCGLSFRFRRLQELEEEDRPKLIRSTSLKSGKTPPGTPRRKKIVRFADSLGLDLEERRQITEDIPNVPLSAFTDLNLEEESSVSPQHRRERGAFDRSPTNNNWNSMVGSAGLSLYPQFSPPINNPDFLDRVRDRGVCLETTTTSDLSLHCVCRVFNFSFEKVVTARYTTNDWLSYEEVTASYVPGSSAENFDRFSFCLFLPNMHPGGKLQFAIRYAVKDMEYWDNNGGENYIVRCPDNGPNLPSPEGVSSWMHHFY